MNGHRVVGALALVMAMALVFSIAVDSQSAGDVAATPAPLLPADAGATPMAATPMARMAPKPASQEAISAGVLEGAWRRYGCEVNPGNPACLTVTLAADCLRHPASSGCTVDRDGDRCTDVSEVLAGFDPFDGADCLSNRAGAPAINCLFPAGNLPCNEIPGITAPARAADGCAVEAAVERTLHPGNPYTCAGPAPSELDCAVFDRDPACDGFAPRRD